MRLESLAKNQFATRRRLRRSDGAIREKCLLRPRYERLRTASRAHHTAQGKHITCRARQTRSSGPGSGYKGQRRTPRGDAGCWIYRTDIAQGRGGDAERLEAAADGRRYTRPLTAAGKRTAVGAASL